MHTPERRDSLFVRGQAYSPLQLAIEAARLAYYRVEGAPVDLQRLAEALDRVDFGSPKVFVHAPTSPRGRSPPAMSTRGSRQAPARLYAS